MGSNARRAAGIVVAGAVALAGTALLIAPTASGDLVVGVLAIVVVLGVLQVMIGLSVVAGGQPLDRAVVDRAAWGAGWVLDGTRAIGLAVSIWMIFAPDAGPISPAGWVILAAVLLSAPYSRRLDTRAVPALAPGTYVVRATPAPMPQVLPLLRAVEPVRQPAPVRVLHAVRSAEPVLEPRRLHRIDTRL